MSANDRVYQHRPLGHSIPSSAVHAPSAGPILVHAQNGANAGPAPGQPASGVLVVGPANGGPVATAQAGAARLHDLLDFVKAEFEALAGEGAVLRGQREEFEGMINHHVNELNAMRAMSYDLERRHADEKRLLQDDISHLKDENTRLRQQLEARATGSVPPPAAPSRPTLPSLLAQTSQANPSARPGSSQGYPPPPAHDYPASGGPYGAEVREREELAAKRARDDEERWAVAKQGAPSMSRPGSVPIGQPLAQPGSSHTLPPISSHPQRRDSPAVGPSSDAAHKKEDPPSSAAEPYEQSAATKKEGSDWLTMFNPNVKRVIDVGLVHTLVHDSVVCCVQFSADGKTLATGCNRNTTLYDTKTGAKTAVLAEETTAPGADNYIRVAMFSPDGKLLATGSEDRMIRIWDLRAKRIWKVFQGHKSEIYSLAFSPDGKRLVSGSGDKTARMWDMDTGACLYTLNIEEPPATSAGESSSGEAGVTSVVLSPDGKFLAASSLDHMVRIWDAASGQLIDKLKGHKDSVYSVAFSPDGKFLVSGSLDKTLKMWDIVSLKIAIDSKGKSLADLPLDGKTPCMTTMQGHKDYVLSVAMAPDGAWIVSGSKDRGVQFWDPKTAKAQFMLQGHKNSIMSVAVSPAGGHNGGLVATGSGDWLARIWSYERI